MGLNTLKKNSKMRVEKGNIWEFDLDMGKFPQNKCNLPAAAYKSLTERVELDRTNNKKPAHGSRSKTSTRAVPLLPRKPRTTAV